MTHYPLWVESGRLAMATINPKRTSAPATDLVSVINVSVDLMRAEKQRNQFAFGFGIKPEIKPGLHFVSGVTLCRGEDEVVTHRVAFGPIFFLSRGGGVRIVSGAYLRVRVPLRASHSEQSEAQLRVRDRSRGERNEGSSAERKSRADRQKSHTRHCQAWWTYCGEQCSSSGVSRG